jgi:hypothetical protein
MQPVQPQGRRPIGEQERAAIINAEVARAAHNGWTVQTVSQGQAVLTKNNRIGWFWNTVLAFVTVGLWLIVVIYRVVNRKQQTMIISVDAYGKVSRR